MKRFLSLIPAFALASSSFASVPFLHKNTQKNIVSKSIAEIPLDDFSGVWRGRCVYPEDSSEFNTTMRIKQTKESIQLTFEEEDDEYTVDFDLGKLHTSQSSNTSNLMGRIAYAQILGNNTVSFYLDAIGTHYNEDGSSYGQGEHMGIIMQMKSPDSIEVYEQYEANGGKCTLNKVS